MAILYGFDPDNGDQVVIGSRLWTIFPAIYFTTFVVNQTRVWTGVITANGGRFGCGKPQHVYGLIADT